MRRLAYALALFAALALLTTACASSKATGLPTGPTEAPSSAVCPATIEMTDQLKFVPDKCEVKVGTTVTWEVTGSAPHTVTSEPTAPVKFDSETVAAGNEFTFAFSAAGEVPYYCKLHAAAGARSGMVGTIVVAAA